MAYLIIGLSVLAGGGSLLGLGVFLVLGSYEAVPLGLTETNSLLLDAGLSLLFFLQHSGMIRKSFRQKLAAVFPASYHPALYSIASGVALLILLVFWQKSDVLVWSASGAAGWILWGLFAGAAIGFFWGVRALGTFDSFGAEAIRKSLREETSPRLPLTIRGPYRIVRHPLYTFMLVIFWACPTVTLDRLLFAVLWTIWVVVGTVLEERDLVACFGESYRAYQRRVPMLLPRMRGGLRAGPG